MTNDDRRLLDKRFEDIYREHFDRIAAYLLARADRDLAAEALSRTFEVAWRQIVNVPGEPLPSPGRACTSRSSSYPYLQALSAEWSTWVSPTAEDPKSSRGDKTTVASITSKSRQGLARHSGRGLSPQRRC
jgi:hypothetical protein